MRLIEWVKQALDGTPRISRRRAWEAWSREEMDRHPVERVELWRGMEGPHYPVGLPLRRFEVSKVPVFRRGLVAGLLLVAGVGGVIGHPVAGRLADRRGRRLAGAIFYGAFPLLGLVFYGGPSWMVPIAWVPMIFAMTGGSTIARALSTELFPTSYRGTASGWLTLLETLGAAGGLFAVSWLTAEGASAVPAVRIVMFLAVVASVAVLLLPETGQRELEDISSDS